MTQLTGNGGDSDMDEMEDEPPFAEYFPDWVTGPHGGVGGMQEAYDAGGIGGIQQWALTLLQQV